MKQIAVLLIEKINLMDKLLTLTFKDPVLLSAAVFIVAAVITLLWAVAKLQALATSPLEDAPYEPDAVAPEKAIEENSGLTEARIQEIVNQLSAINQRLTSIEKSFKDKKQNDQTLQAIPASIEIEDIVKKIGSKLELLSGDKPDLSASMSKLEAKLEGIHRLIIVLTDSGSPEQK